MFFNFLVRMRKLRSRKFRKPKNGKRQKVDRLSDLPDDILIHILSFLRTKIYVATSILGRRWRFLWARVPNIDLVAHEDLPGGDDDLSIINRVIYLHKRQNINSFRLGLFQESGCIGSSYELEKWITTAIECNVQNLDLASEQRLPNCIFTCKTLVDLRLAWLYMPTTGTTIYLPVLKMLRLHQVYFGSAECFHHLLSGCPVLNELFITTSLDIDDYSFTEDSENFCCISSPTIYRLELDEIRWHEGDVFRVKLDTPALEYLRVDNYEPYLLHEVLSEDFSHVPRSAFFASTGTFHNITELELDADWRFVPSFLEKANNLQVLTIRWYHFEFPTYWINPNQVPACLVSHLGTVIIRKFWCTEPEYKAVKYILRNAIVLKMMEIYLHSENFRDFYNVVSREEFEAVERITLFE